MHIADKRFTQKDGSIMNRKKFIDRYKKSIKEAIKGVVSGQSIKDFQIGNKKIKIKTDGDPLDLPSFEFDTTEGVFEGISVGNKTYRKGDRIAKPKSGQGQGREGSAEGGGEDSFEFQLTPQEFSDLFFEDLELPDMVKKSFIGDSYEIQRMGYSNSGGPSSLNIKQTIIRAIMRRTALQKKEDKEDEESKDLLLESEPRKKKISFLEETDLKFNYRDKVDIPSSKAVMICLMDVSGSMGEKEKDLAKRFYILLHMFLKRNYDNVDVVFIRHTEVAEEVSEERFFNDRDSGGTVVSSGLECALETIRARYNPEQYNIYMAQATDGDNWSSDNSHVINILTQHLLPICQYYAYTELMTYRDRPSELFHIMEKIKGGHKNLATSVISDYKDIFDVFRQLFKKNK